MATEGMNPKFANWSKERRFAEAARRHVIDGWTQGAAAREYGVSRGRLNLHCQAFRKEHEARLEEAKADLERRKSAVSPVGINERRRVGTFAEFDDRYFGRWVCPDCEVHHDRPAFHNDIIDAIEGTDQRVLVNVPPYHAKSTLVTVKQTVFEIVRNPNIRRLIVSKSLPFARTFLHSIDQLLTNPDLYEGGPSLLDDWGPFKSEEKGSVWNKEQIYVAGRSTAEKDPTVQVLGVGGQIYGRRADQIIFDDIADTDNQLNPAQVEKMLTWIDKMALSRIGRAKGKAVWIGTRVHSGDIYSFLQHRPGYRVIRWPCILDDTLEQVLWPDHFPYSAALLRREEMRPADWQLVYQNVDVPGLGASFSEEMLDSCRDQGRIVGHHEPRWRLVAGLDLAGAGRESGYTAGVITGIDLETGKRFLVDAFNEKAMKAPRLKDQLYDWADQYPLYELRVESNGLQSQLIQYNEEIVRYLAQRGVRVVPHITSGHNKWDPEFGVDAMAPLYSAQLVSIPWGNAASARLFQQLVEQLMVFPMGMISDLVMAAWFSELGCRDLLRRAHLPMFSERMKVPNRVRRRRIVVDFGGQQVRRVPVHEQSSVTGAYGVSNWRRRTVGNPRRPGQPDPPPPDPGPDFVNIPRPE